MGKAKKSAAVVIEPVPLPVVEGVKSLESPSPSPSPAAKKSKKPKPAIGKKKVAALTEAQKQYKKECIEVERFCKKAANLQKQGHECINIISSVHPPVLLWCEKKECIMKQKPAVVVEFIPDPKNQSPS